MTDIGQFSEPHILVVDDDARLRGLLRRYLSDNGFRVSVASDAAEARRRLNGLSYDLMVLDVMMPGESGLDLARDLRRESRVPVLLLTAMDAPEDRIAGLESGADDYVVKPFEPRELVLRIRTILRRVGEAAPIAEETAAPDHLVSFGDFMYDLRRDLLTFRDEAVRLTEAETGLLRLFVEAPDETLSREDLAGRNGADGNVRTVDVQITRLRRKIESDPKFPRYLQTVRGKGYVLRLNA